MISHVHSCQPISVRLVAEMSFCAAGFGGSFIGQRTNAGQKLMCVSKNCATECECYAEQTMNKEKRNEQDRSFKTCDSLITFNPQKPKYRKRVLIHPKTVE